MKRVTEAELAKELRQPYIQNPPEGVTSEEVRDMSDDELLDMDYFLCPASAGPSIYIIYSG